MSYIITNTQNYYPEVKDADTIEEAREIKARMMKSIDVSHRVKEGQKTRDVEVVISMVIESDTVKEFD